MIPDLKTALRLGATPRLAFVGAGGKTTALFRLSRNFSSPVIASATTHMESWQLNLADASYFCPDTQVGALPTPSRLQGVSLFVGEPNGRSAAGLSASGIQKACDLAQERQLPLLIEADGSRRHPIKAPAEHEPPIPGFVDIVVVTVGLTALGKSISSDWVHRPEIFASLAEEPPGSLISTEIIRRVLCHPNGGLKNIPANARRVALLNQADSQELRKQAYTLVPALLKTYDAVIISSFKEEKAQCLTCRIH